MKINKTRVVNDSTVKWISEHWSKEPVVPANVPGFGFLSIPFDYAVSYRPGTRFGPQNILEVLSSYSLYCTDKRVSLENTVFYDFGSADIVHSFEQSYANIREAARDIPPQFIPIFLGGDHSIGDPLIRGMQDRLGRKKFGLIIFDAHFDSRDPVPGKEHSGHWMKTLEDVLDYKQVVQLGIDACIYSKHYMDVAEEKGVMVRTPYEIRKKGWDAIIREAIDHAMSGTEAIYISIDIDAISHAFAPGTSVPNAVGLYPYEVIDAVFEIASQSPVAGLDITEVSPPLDHNNYTSHVGAQIVMNFMAGAVKRASL
ncbi:MAG TPA: agmatinase family protein [Blastocatellia bacterium]|jgi:agmatinase